MTKYFILLYRFFCRHQAVYWLSMTALLVFFGYFASRIHLEEDIDKLMPSSKNEDGTTKLAFADLKIKDKTFLLFAQKGKGMEYGDLITVCDAFVDSLAQDSALIEDIFYQLDDDLMPNGIDYLTEHLPAYIDTTVYARFDTLLTREHVAAQMVRNRDDLTGEFGTMFPELIQMDPIGMRDVLSEQMKPLMSAGNYQTLDGHFFVPDSTVCLAFITPRFSSTNTGQGSALFIRLNTLISQFAQSHPQVDISYHGTPASGYYNSSQIKHDLTTTIAGALLLVLLFLLACFRRWDTIPLLLLPVVFGTLFGLTMMYWLKGEFSLLALGIGGVVLGVALSYVLHVLVHHQYVSDGEQLLHDQVKPVWLGCLTTIGSFAGLIFINTALLQDFGLYAAFAIFGTTLFSLTFLPPLLKPRKSGFPAFINHLSTYDASRKTWLLGLIGIISAVCIGFYLVFGTRFDADMHNLGYLEEMTEHSEQLLRDKTTVRTDSSDAGDKQKYFASKGSTMEEALQNFAILDHKLDSLQQLGLVKSYTHTNQLLVPQATQQKRIDAWKTYWTAERLNKVRELIAATAPQAGLNADAFDTFFEAATADYEPSALYEDDVIPRGYLSTLAERSYDGNYLCFTSVRCANDSIRSNESDYIRICDAVAENPNLLVLDTYYYTTDTLIQMSEDFDVLQWLSMAFVFVVLLLAFHFNIKLTLLGFLPILLSWLIVLGAMNWADMSFNLISIIISTFIFGIGVDYSIFVMDGLTNPNQQKLAYHKTAIFLSAVTLIVTVSSMLLAQHPAIKSVGFSTLVGLLAAVILSYVLQPAIYRKINHQK
jgi:predicted exporter